MRVFPRTAAVNPDGRLAIGGCDAAGLARSHVAKLEGEGDEAHVELA